MSNKFKGIDIKNRTNYFFHGIINTKSPQIKSRYMKNHTKYSYLFITLDM